MNAKHCRVQHRPGSDAQRECATHGIARESRGASPSAGAAGAPPAASLPATDGPLPTRDFAIKMLEISDEEFTSHFTPEKVYDQAGRIYEYMAEHGSAPDSVSREALFSYASEELGIDYEDLYQRWISGTTGQ